MKPVRRSLIVVWLTAFSLALSLCPGILLETKVSAAANGGSNPGSDNSAKLANKESKVSSDLRQKLRGARSNVATVRVILQFNEQVSLQLNGFLGRYGIHVNRHFHNLNMRVVELPQSVIDVLADFPQVSFISLDQEVRSFGHVTATSGADDVRTQTTTSLLGGTTTTTLDGTGIGIAVLDSGIDTSHKSFLGKDDVSRVVVSKDFTGENRTDDPYGHGTHVAATAAGNGRVANGKYLGIAPNAKIINLRVLDSQGRGSVSALLSALDWLLNNRTAYNIRVANMSLGTLAVSSYQNDPVCQAVRKLVNAGMVVTAAAGNNGKNSLGNKVYGHIHSPGIEPSAITVGAANTFGTDARADDAITTYSSRGPTRGFTTDANGLKHYDNLIKPDVVAPGNKLVYAEAINNLLVTQHPELDAGVSQNDTRRQMYMSGTSMATPCVAGAAALLLQANSKLTPNMVKAILMYTAQPLSGFNMFEQGAGEINLKGAVQLAKLFKTNLLATTLVGTSLLTAAAPSPQTTIANHTFNWAQGLIFNRTYATGTALITSYQKV